MDELTKALIDSLKAEIKQINELVISARKAITQMIDVSVTMAGVIDHHCNVMDTCAGDPETAENGPMIQASIESMREMALTLPILVAMSRANKNVTPEGGKK